MQEAQTTPERGERRSAYDMMGGAEAVQRLVTRFYDVMDSDAAYARLRAMHAGDLGPMRERLYAFLSGWLGGPRLYGKCVMSAHAGLAIGEAERDQWLACMRVALDGVTMPGELKAMIEAAFARMAGAMRSR